MRLRVPLKLRLLAQSVLLLGVTTAAFAYLLRPTHAGRESSYLLVMLFPGVALAFYCVVAAMIPNLLSIGRLRWPLTLTLPIVYGALLQLTLALGLQGHNPIVRQSLMIPAGWYWQEPTVMVDLAVSQIFVLSAWAMLFSRSDRPE